MRARADRGNLRICARSYSVLRDGTNGELIMAPTLSNYARIFGDSLYLRVLASTVLLGALVALIHCLIVDLDRRLDAGETLPTMPPWHVQENKWRAARYGLDAVIILDADSSERLVTDHLVDVLTRLEPVAKSLNCVDELRAVADIPRDGASYQRQRRVAEEHDGDLRAVVDALVAELDI